MITKQKNSSGNWVRETNLNFSTFSIQNCSGDGRGWEQRENFLFFLTPMGKRAKREILYTWFIVSPLFVLRCPLLVSVLNDSTSSTYFCKETYIKADFVEVECHLELQYSTLKNSNNTIPSLSLWIIWCAPSTSSFAFCTQVSRCYARFIYGKLPIVWHIYFLFCFSIHANKFRAYRRREDLERQINSRFIEYSAKRTIERKKC